ncbi:MAG: N-acetylmuramoyl-L-alanine amidase [Hominilimicola sp.]
MRIGINPGHTVSGQPGCGAVGFIDESVETRNVGYKLMALLKQAGHTVVDCTNDYAPTTSSNLSQIVELANKQPLDLFVSIHFNAGGGKGTEVYTYGAAKHTEAVNVCNALNKLGFVNRGIKDGSNLYVVRRSDAKAMLIEVCFVDTQSDVDLYKQLGADCIAQAICTAITGQEINNKEELTLGQYEELKQMIADRDKRIEALENKVGREEEVYNYVDENMPEWVKSDVQWMMDRDILVGDDDGKLGLSPIKLWTIAIVARMARYLGKLMSIKM